MNPQLLLLRGVPGTGKSTLSRALKHFYIGSEHYEADMFFIGKDGDYKFNIAQIHRAHQWCESSTEKALAEGKYVIVSNTFTTLKEMKPYFQMIQAYGKQPAVYTAQTEFGSIHGVPEEVLVNMRARFAYDLSSLYQMLPPKA